MTGLLALLAAGALWLAYELVGQMVGGVASAVLAPVVRPVARLAGRLSGGRPVAVLWLFAVASYAFWPYSQGASGEATRIMGLAAFLAATPLALMATLSWRSRARQAIRPVAGAGHASSAAR